MKVLILSTGADTGGAAIRIVEAFRSPVGARSEWKARSMVATVNYIRYPIDLVYNAPDLEENYDEADVVVLFNTLAGHDYYDEELGKPTVLMHHGWHTEKDGHFPVTAQQTADRCADIGAVQTCSTVNLELLRPLGPIWPGTVTWTPIPYDLKALLTLRNQLFEPNPDSFRVFHSPTSRSIKSTDALVAAVERLRSDGRPIELILVENKTHAETMELKAKYADLVVDQLKLGYGNNAIEAWAMGIPVIGGVYEHPDWRYHMQQRYQLSDSPTGLPFYEANEDSLADAVLEMSQYSSLRKEWASIGLTHVWKHHSYEEVVPLLSEVYDTAASIRTTPGGLARSRRQHRRTLTRSERLALLRANVSR